MVKLTEETGPDGTVAQIGQIVIDWVCIQSKQINGMKTCFCWVLQVEFTAL